MTVAQIRTAIQNPIDANSLKALQEYKAAAEQVRTNGPRANDSDVIAKNLV